MPSAADTNVSTLRPPQDEPQPLAEAQPTKRDLASWWKTFKKNAKKEEDQKEFRTAQGIFGVPLSVSIRYANVAISLFDENGNSFTYGYVPIVVAKCGVFLKEKATDVEGIFRLAGAERRIKELQTLFNSPERYGKGLDWSGYTVHDAANVLRRYFNQLPEPIIPLEFYERFRAPLRHHQAEAVGAIDMQEAAIGNFDANAAIKTYQTLITELPPLNRQLLLYILDLLAVFASKSDLNRMTAANLSAIFQPGLLSHPTHDMAPSEYRLSQDVLIFLIENQDHFLVGMVGTAADEKTIQDVQSGAYPQQNVVMSPATPGLGAKQGLGRSASNASAGADSVRRFGGVRRNVSVSSKHSRQSNNSSGPITPPPGSPYSTGGKGSGVHRSNTLPSKKSPSPALGTARFTRGRNPDDASPIAISHNGPVVASPLSSETSTITGVATGHAMDRQRNAPSQSTSSRVRDLSPHLRPAPKTNAKQSGQDRQRLDKLAMDMPASNGRDLPPNTTPSRERTFSSLFKQSPGSDNDKKDNRRPNKLQKKRLAENPNTSAHSSSQDLSSSSHPPSPAFAPHMGFDRAAHSQLEGHHSESSSRPVDQLAGVAELKTEEYLAALSDEPETVRRGRGSTDRPTASSRDELVPSTALRAMPQRTSGTTLRPRQSPAGSFSSAVDYSSHDNADDSDVEERQKEKKRRWRTSASSRKDKNEQQQQTRHLATPAIGVATSAGISTSSVASMGGIPGKPRKSFTDDSNPSTNLSAEGPSLSDVENGNTGVGNVPTEKKGPIGWFRGKLQERKEREAEKERAKSPPPAGRAGEAAISKQNLGAVVVGEGAPASPKPALRGVEGSPRVRGVLSDLQNEPQAEEPLSNGRS